MGLRDRLKKADVPPPRTTPAGGVGTPSPSSPSWTGITTEVYQNLKHELHQKLIEKLDLGTIEKLPREQLRDELRLILNQLLAVSDLPLNRVEREQMVEELLDEVTGLGPLVQPIT